MLRPTLAKAQQHQAISGTGADTKMGRKNEEQRGVFRRVVGVASSRITAQTHEDRGNEGTHKHCNEKHG